MPANPITPNFSRKIAVKAQESKDRSREERRAYTQFLQRLCEDDIACGAPLLQDRDGAAVSEDEDDVYDVLATVGDSDDGPGDETPRAIPSRELFELFEEEVLATMDPVASEPLFKNIKRECPATWSLSILEQINKQVNLHFQLLVQNLALSGEVRNADQVWVTVLKLMIKFGERFEEDTAGPIKLLASPGLSMLLRILRQSPLHETLLNQIKKAKNNDGDLRLKARVTCIPFQLKHKDGRIPKLSKSFWHILSLFGEPFDPKQTIAPKNIYGECSTLIDHQANLFLADRSYKQRRVDKFLAVEDDLLLLGLQRYGFGNWEKIQSTLLPTRTARQIYVRYKNMVTRRAPANPIKAFVEEVMKPLSLLEEELILQGVRTYGEDWASISERFLPHRPAIVLRRLWQRRFVKPVKEEPADRNTIINIQFPTEDESDSDYVELS